MRSTGTITGALFLLAFTTLARAQDDAVDPGMAALAAADARVARLAWVLQTANVALCPADVRAIPGFAVQSLSQFGAKDRVRAARFYGDDPHPIVSAVAAQSGAARAGLRTGDIILSINGLPTPDVLPGRASYDAVGETEARIDTALAHAPVRLSLRRAGRTFDMVIVGDRGCASRVQLVPHGSINARADGRYIQIDGDMLDFVRSDDELAAVMAHELAHNILHHHRDDTVQRITKAQSRANEYAADQLGVWLYARAGFDLAAQLPLFSRLKAKVGGGLFPDRFHPGWNDRIARIADAIGTIERQRAAHQPLIPPSAVAQ